MKYFNLRPMTDTNPRIICCPATGPTTTIYHKTPDSLLSGYVSFESNVWSLNELLNGLGTRITAKQARKLVGSKAFNEFHNRMKEVHKSAGSQQPVTS